MTLPASGAISLVQIAGELGASLPLSLIDSRVLTLAGKGALPISMSDLYAKSGQAALSATAIGQDNQYSTTTSGGTASSTGTVYPAGGSGGYTCVWSVVSNTGGATVGALNGQIVSISKTFTKLSDGVATVTFNVTVTDSQGHTFTVSNVNVIIEWYSNR